MIGLALLLLLGGPPARDNPSGVLARTKGKDVSALLAPGFRIISQLNVDVAPAPGAERVALVGELGDAGAVSAVALVVAESTAAGVRVLASGPLATSAMYSVNVGPATLDLDGDGRFELPVEAAAGEGERAVAETTWYAVRGERVVPIYTLMRRRWVDGAVETRRLESVAGRVIETVERRGAPPARLQLQFTPAGFRLVDWQR